ncbi:MAG TPA: hypothetical protein VGE76_07010, partial [Opitutaceae bacterium]
METAWILFDLGHERVRFRKEAISKSGSAHLLIVLQNLAKVPVNEVVKYSRHPLAPERLLYFLPRHSGRRIGIELGITSQSFRHTFIFVRQNLRKRIEQFGRKNRTLAIRETEHFRFERLQPCHVSTMREGRKKATISFCGP